jgi:hypothetical protein
VSDFVALPYSRSDGDGIAERGLKTGGSGPCTRSPGLGRVEPWSRGYFSSRESTQQARRPCSACETQALAHDDDSGVSVGQFRVRDVLVARQDDKGAAFEIVRDGPEAQRIFRQDYAGLLLAMSTVVTVCPSMPVTTYT